MSPASRRIYLYWLLLLIPTLVVGSGAIYLLRREQERFSQQTAAAIASREAAIATRARLVVENIELFMGDVQTGLLDTLASEPAGSLDGFLERWVRNNPLVRTAFLSTAEGRLLRPAGDALDDEARAFIRWFSRVFGARPPWAAGAGTPAAPIMPGLVEKEAKDEAAARKDISFNVAQVQSARRDVQELVKVRDEPTLAMAAPPASEPRFADEVSGYRGRAEQDAAAGSPVGGLRQRLPAAEEAKAQAIAPAVVAKAAAAGRRGWTPWIEDGRLYLIGWVQPGGAGDVRGVELELAALISRLAAVLPVEPGAGEGYVLRNHQGRVIHQAGWVPDEGQPVAGVPLASALLPGWTVGGYLQAGKMSDGSPAGLFGLGTLLVAIFVVAILSGGSLLLWQARRSEEEAAQKTSFVANVSHEFKTPLTTIRLYSELLEQGRVRDAAQGSDYLRTIGRETQRLARLVNNALDFSRLEQGRKKFACEPLDLTAGLTRLLDTHAPRISEAGMKLERVLPVVSLQVSTDRDAFEQIVLNVLDNACKYAAEGGEVVVTLRPGSGGRGAEVGIGDRGPGVAVEHRERIFDKFHRIDDALTAEKTGTGLGLSIARKLARGL
ncbi:MAG: histidine kinase dimerization/phospho-acceptor domain-containing protein, partial [Opitutus sp.]